MVSRSDCALRWNLAHPAILTPTSPEPAGKRERGQQLKRDGVLIRTWDLRKAYVMGDQEIHAVSGIDIEIKKGEYVAIMGPPAPANPPL